MISRRYGAEANPKGNDVAISMAGLNAAFGGKRQGVAPVLLLVAVAIGVAAVRVSDMAQPVSASTVSETSGSERIGVLLKSNRGQRCRCPHEYWLNGLAQRQLYQIFARLSGAIYSLSVGCTFHASYHAWTLRSGANARNWPGLCGSVATWLRTASSRAFERQTCA